MDDTLTSPEPAPMRERAWGTLIAPPQTPQRRAIVLVLGMHRSGTSLCAHVLSALGVDMTDVIDAQPSNAKGHWERREIVEFHDRVLDSFNRGYYSSYHNISLPVAWWADPRAGEVRQEIVAFLSTRMGGAPFGFKDPRTARLLPMWHQIFGELDLQPKFIVCLRNPGQVARSLLTRDGLDDDSGELRWFSYVIDCFRYTKNCDFRVVEYETWFEDPAENVAKLRSLIEPSWLERELDPDPLIAEIIDDRLRHDDREHRRARLPLVRSLYALARRADRDSGAREQILTIAAQYVAFDQLQAAFQRNFERNTELALRVPALEQEVAGLKAALEESEAALVIAQAADVAARAEQSAAREKRALAELDRVRAQLARQRVVEQLAAAEAMHAEMTGLRKALAAAEAEARERRAELDSMGRELVEMSEALAEIGRHAAERTARELSELHRALADSERIADEHRTTAEQQIAAASARIADLEAQLADRSADGEAAAERETAARAEIEHQRTLIAELTRQRPAAERAADSARDQVAALREQIAAVERRAREREAELENDAAAKAAELSARLSERMRAAREAEARIEQLDAELLASNARRLQRAGLWGRVLRRARQRQARTAIRAGDRASRSGDAAAAARCYRLAVDRSPGLPAIWVQLGHALKELGDFGGAEAAYRQSLALDGSVADTHLQLGHLLKLTSRWAEAAQAYARALRLDPGQPQVGRELDDLCRHLLHAGDQARDARDWPEAARCYRGALDVQPEMTGIWVQLGHALKEQGDFHSAEAAYRQSLALDESIADTHLQLGHALKLLGRWGEAADAYHRALQLDPGLSQAGEELDHLAPHLVQQAEEAGAAGNWPVAAWYYRRALERQPENAAIWFRLGCALDEQGDHVMAEPAYRQALALDGALAEAHLRLGGVLQRWGHHAQAIDAYAAALRLAPELDTASQALQALLIEPQQGEDRAPATAAEASTAGTTDLDVIWLGVIDWHYRIQRPQHLAANLADLGGRVFYVSLVFEPPDDKGRFRINESPHHNVFEVRMRFPGNAAENLYRGLSERAIAELQLGLDELISVLGIRAPVVVVEHPAWQLVACGVPSATVVYDCLDLATGFSTAAKSTITYEAAMLATADLVVAASRPLIDHIATSRSSVLVRNAADVEFFSQGFTDRPPGERPVIGYFGAIADWFNIEWIERCAAARPDWDFRLVGRTDGCNTARAARLRNVRFLGEKPYRDLPPFLREVDVAIIPFKMIELIRCTNPVKLYEYMAAGKAVVASPMPEVIELTDLAYIAEDAQSFTDRIAQALAEDSTELRLRRLAWAREHTWENRARALKQAIEATLPLVSVVILTHNNWDYTAACLSSVLRDTDYPNLEIIVVDNASTDQTRDNLRQMQRQVSRIRVVLTDKNLGFGGGNNVGLRVARGEFVIMLNNDTVVTRGWVRDLIRPMQLDPRIGLAGPLTNSIGNEQKVKPGYGAVRDMPQWARRFVRGRLRRTFEAGNLAFFCVAMRRSVIAELGLLDEAYGLGFFEDDDYCRRATQAGYKLVIVDDVFVHHQLSASYAKIGSQAKDELMARNKAIFEERWGKWQAHRYRDEPGFGA